MQSDNFEEEEFTGNEIEAELLLLRLVTGEDIIALTISDPEEDAYYLDNPMKIQYFMDRISKKNSSNIIPWISPKLIEKDQLLRVFTSDVITTAIPSDKLEEVYYSAIELYHGNSLPLTKNTHSEVMEEINTQDRLEPSLKSNKKVKNWVNKELKRIKKGI